METSTPNKQNWTHWFEIPVSDMKRAQKFYETVFDTKIDIMQFGPNFEMGIFPHLETGCALVFNPEFYVPSQDGVLVYMNALPDLQPTLDRIVTAGGNVIQTKTQISPEHGFMAIFLDSEGNRLALHSME